MLAAMTRVCSLLMARALAALLIVTAICSLAVSNALRTAVQQQQQQSYRRTSSSSRLSSSLGQQESGEESLSKPRWAGADDPLSNVVNFFINSPLYQIMKPLARSTLISTAEKNGINWTSRVKFYERNLKALEKIYDDLVDRQSAVDYPSYYTKPFHAYDTGNLEYKAAFEVESATYSMALRVWPGEDGLTAVKAQDRLRYSYLDTVAGYLNKHGISTEKMKRLIDVGCSAGVSTLYLAEAFKSSATIDALDLSPYFLSVAKFQKQRIMDGQLLTADSAVNGENDALFAAESDAITSRFASSGVERINYILGNAENTALAESSYDLVSISFMFHELPQLPMQNILNEMFRITSVGGVIALTDNNPRSRVIQNLPPALFTLMKSTEPWSDEYYSFNLEEAMREAGYVDVYYSESDPRHRTLVARRAVKI